MDAEKELALQAPPTEQVFGIAKKMSLELQKLPLHTEAAIISMMNMMCQHRKVVLESEMQAKQMAAQAEAMAAAQLAHQRRDEMLAGQMTAETKQPRILVPTAQ